MVPARVQLCHCSKDRGWPRLVAPGVSEWTGNGEGSLFSGSSSLILAVLKILKGKVAREDNVVEIFTKPIGINNTVVDKVLSRDNG